MLMLSGYKVLSHCSSSCIASFVYFGIYRRLSLCQLPLFRYSNIILDPYLDNLLLLLIANNETIDKMCPTLNCCFVAHTRNSFAIICNHLNKKDENLFVLASANMSEAY